MNQNVIFGILAIVAGLLILVWPILLNFVVVIALLSVGAWFLYVGLSGRRTMI